MRDLVITNRVKTRGRPFWIDRIDLIDREGKEVYHKGLDLVYLCFSKARICGMRVGLEFRKRLKLQNNITIETTNDVVLPKVLD